MVQFVGRFKYHRLSEVSMRDRDDLCKKAHVGIIGIIPEAIITTVHAARLPGVKQ